MPKVSEVDGIETLLNRIISALAIYLLSNY
jgi:hypothetical protein